MSSSQVSNKFAQIFACEILCASGWGTNDEYMIYLVYSQPEEKRRWNI